MPCKEIIDCLCHISLHSKSSSFVMQMPFVCSCWQMRGHIGHCPVRKVHTKSYLSIKWTVAWCGRINAKNSIRRMLNVLRQRFASGKNTVFFSVVPSCYGNHGVSFIIILRITAATSIHFHSHDGIWSEWRAECSSQHPTNTVLTLVACVSEWVCASM